MMVIKNTKLNRRIILVLGIFFLITSSVIFLRAIIEYPDVERNMNFTVEAENVTWVTLSNIRGTNDLKGSFEVAEGNLDFIIASQEWSHSWGLIILGLGNQITGTYSMQNVSEDHFDLQLNSIDELHFNSEEWYLVFDNRDHTQEKNVNLHYSLHPHTRDAFNVIAFVLFTISICIFIILATFTMGEKKNAEIEFENDENQNIKPSPQIIKITCPQCGIALRMKGSGDMISVKCSNCAAVFTVKVP
jgi:hypothetical protein